jgi:hypothetical protein
VASGLFRLPRRRFVVHSASRATPQGRDFVILLGPEPVANGGLPSHPMLRVGRLARFMLSQVGNGGTGMIAEHFLVWAGLLGVLAFLAFHSAGQSRG